MRLASRNKAIIIFAQRDIWVLSVIGEEGYVGTVCDWVGFLAASVINDASLGLAVRIPRLGFWGSLGSICVFVCDAGIRLGWL